MKRLKAIPWYWYGFGIVIFLCLMEIWGILGNWSTIVLAAFTIVYVRLIYESIRENSRIRDENFMRQCLDLILNWARTGVPILSEDISVQNLRSLELLLRRLIYHHAERESMLSSSRIFDIYFQNAVFKAVSKLEQLFDLASIMTQGPIRPETKEHDYLLETKKEAREAFVELLESASKLKVELHL